MTITATPTKLTSGDWGAKVQSASVAEGDIITITTKAGKSWQATVAKVVWTGEGVAIVATESRQSSSRSSGRFGRRYSNYASGGRRCSYCGSRSCSGAWGDLCEQD